MAEISKPRRSIGRAFVAALGLLLTPPVLGAAYMLAFALYRLTSVTVLGDVELMSKEQADELSVMMHALFGVEIVEIVIAIGGTAIVVGGALGLLAWGLILLRAQLTGRPTPGGLRLSGHALLLTAALELAIELGAMSRHPELFAGSWYRGNAVKRAVQLFATEHLGPSGCVALCLSLAAAYLVWPSDFSRGWRGWTAVLAQSSRELGARIGVAGGALVIALVFGAGMLFRSPALAHTRVATTRPNIIVLAVDSLRADRIEGRVAPNLFELSQRATKFERAYVSVPHTFPSWVTILTGRHAHRHGIRSMFPRYEDRARRFDAVPERLARAGYGTAVVSDYAGDMFSHVDLGFLRTDVPFLNMKQLLFVRALESQTGLLPFIHSRFGRRIFPSMREVRAGADPEMLADDSIRMLETMTADERPFFLTVFFSTAHFPYAAPYPHYKTFTDPSYRGPFKYGRQLGVIPEGTYDEADVRQIRGLYDGAIASVDAAVGRIVAELSRSGLLQNTIVIVTADHGEALDESFGDIKRGFSHGSHLFGDEQLHVPLIVYDPRAVEGPKVKGAVTDIVRDVDLAPTIYELAGIELPHDLDGRSLVPALHGNRLADSARAYAETGVWFERDEVPHWLRIPYPTFAILHEVDLEHDAEFVIQKAFEPLTLVAKHRMIRDDRFKLIYIPTRTGVMYELYDTESDPNEVKNVADLLPAERDRLAAELWTWMLRDQAMMQQDGFLVPRDPEAPAPSPRKGAFMRLGTRGEAPALKPSAPQ